jgi:UDP-N-acetylglucosamine diphosphorylase/glucosamine-1-phosphate N-acetyltransferase
VVNSLANSPTDPTSRPLAVCILAAGKGKRMGDPERAKVLTPLLDKPLLGYVLETASQLHPVRTVVIVGHQREAVAAYAHTQAPYINIAVQDQQLGTGHAVLQTQEALADLEADVLILSGDVPLLSAPTLNALLDHHRGSGAALTILTTSVDDPTGYGRIVRDGQGAVARIVEHKDATDEERAIREINSGIYRVKSEVLFDALHHVRNANAQGEYYLTDIAGILQADGQRVEALVTADADEVHGINTPQDLQRAQAIIESRTVVGSTGYPV